MGILGKVQKKPSKPTDLIEISQSGLNTPTNLSELSQASPNVPTNLTELSQNNLLTPTNLYEVGFDRSARCARILYNNLITSALSPSLNPLLRPTTYDRWVDESDPMTGILRLSSTSQIDTIAIGAHNLGTTNSTITVSVRSGTSGAFTTVGTATPSDNRSIMFFFSLAGVRDIEIDVANGTNREIGVVYAGRSLVMEREIFGGHSPINLNERNEYRNIVSSTGNFLGRHIKRQGYTTQFTWTKINDGWYRTNYEPFRKSATKTPFFICWRPDIYSSECAYGVATGDAQPSNEGGGTRLMTVSLNMVAHA